MILPPSGDSGTAAFLACGAATAYPSWDVPFVPGAAAIEGPLVTQEATEPAVKRKASWPHKSPSLCINLSPASSASFTK